MKKKDKELWLYAVIGSDSEPYKRKDREAAQIRSLKEYAASHNIHIAKVIRKSGLDNTFTSNHVAYMAGEVTRRHSDGIILVNMNVLTHDMSKAYYYIGMMNKVGGKVVSMEEGSLSLPLHMDRIKKDRKEVQQ